MPGTFTFKPIEASLVRDTELIGKMSPYCSLLVENKKFTSVVCNKGGKNPIWNDTITIETSSCNPVLKLELLDKDLMTQDDIIGGCTIELKDLETKKHARNWYPLFYNDKPAGEVLLETIFDSTKPIQEQDIPSEEEFWMREGQQNELTDRVLEFRVDGEMIKPDQNLPMKDKNDELAPKEAGPSEYDVELNKTEKRLEGLISEIDSQSRSSCQHEFKGDDKGSLEVKKSDKTSVEVANPPEYGIELNKTEKRLEALISGVSSYTGTTGQREPKLKDMNVVELKTTGEATSEEARPLKCDTKLNRTERRLEGLMSEVDSCGKVPSPGEQGDKVSSL